MIFVIENCSGNTEKLRSIIGIRERKDGKFEKKFNSLEELMILVRTVGEIIIYPSKNDNEEFLEDTIRIYDSWNE